MSGENGTYLSRADILSMQDVRAEDVKVDAWGGRPVRVRAMTALEAGRYTSGMLRAAGEALRSASGPGAQALALAAGQAYQAEQRVELVIQCAIDAEGLPLFQASDAPSLSAKSNDAIDQLSQAILRLSKVTPAAEAEAVEAERDFSADTPASG